MTKNQITLLESVGYARLIRAEDTGSYYLVPALSSGSEAVMMRSVISVTLSQMLLMPPSSEWRMVVTADTEVAYVIPPGVSGADGSAVVMGDARGNLEAVLDLPDATSSVPGAGVLARVGRTLVIGDDNTLGGVPASSDTMGRFYQVPYLGVAVSKTLTAADHGAVVVTNPLALVRPKNAYGYAVTVPNDPLIPVGFSCRVVIPYIGSTVGGGSTPRLVFDSALQVFYHGPGGLAAQALDSQHSVAPWEYLYVPPPISATSLVATFAVSCAYPDAFTTVITPSSLNGVAAGALSGGLYYVRVLTLSGQWVSYPIVTNTLNTITVSGCAADAAGRFLEVRKYETLSSWVNPALVTADPATTVNGVILSSSTSAFTRRTQVMYRNMVFYVSGGLWKRSGVTDAGGQILDPNFPMVFQAYSASHPTVTVTKPGRLTSLFVRMGCDVQLTKTGAAEWLMVGRLV